MPSSKPASLTADTAPVDPTLVVPAQSADGSADFKVAIGDFPVSTPQQTAIDLRIPSTQKAAANGVASLDANGKVPVTQIPQSAFTSVDVVASQAAMLALSGAVEGALALRTDNGNSYVLSTNSPGTLADWILFNSGTVTADSIVDGTVNHVFTAADDTKLTAIEPGAVLGVIVYEYNGSTWVRNTVPVKLFINRIDNTPPTTGFTDGVDVFLLAP